MGSLSYFGQQRELNYRKIRRPIGAEPGEVFISVLLEDVAYRRFTPNTLLIFTQGLIRKRGTHLIEYGDGDVMPVGLDFIGKDVVQLTSLHPDLESGEYKLKDLKVLGKLREIYSGTDPDSRYILWDEDYEITKTYERPILTLKK